MELQLRDHGACLGAFTGVGIMEFAAVPLWVDRVWGFAAKLGLWCRTYCALTAAGSRGVQGSLRGFGDHWALSLRCRGLQGSGLGFWAPL